ncbi:hypothetical protein CXG81DRAFT_19473 [Caulochytrium protostelioides]|uniref:RGS domain-containing protein n=1 Tax=Caulochytrium protostelioides TaxID=1555241 RepID=A0A4P9X606_9FUNG|nr:hypothetical protein CXG81DRAFT_19473 [Caulochytrium protostelioides]|eukprot:RKP00594.1 hypothetical protein CXG81DRAFT_19473 [Caulochytrium protostelioides]
MGYRADACAFVTAWDGPWAADGGPPRPPPSCIAFWSVAAVMLAVQAAALVALVALRFGAPAVIPPNSPLQTMTQGMGLVVANSVTALLLTAAMAVSPWLRGVPLLWLLSGLAVLHLTGMMLRLERRVAYITRRQAATQWSTTLVAMPQLPADDTSHVTVACSQHSSELTAVTTAASSSSSSSPTTLPSTSPGTATSTTTPAGGAKSAHSAYPETTWRSKDAQLRRDPAHHASTSWRQLAAALFTARMTPRRLLHHAVEGHGREVVVVLSLALLAACVMSLVVTLCAAAPLGHPITWEYLPLASAMGLGFLWWGLRLSKLRWQDETRDGMAVTWMAYVGLGFVAPIAWHTTHRSAPLLLCPILALGVGQLIWVGVPAVQMAILFYRWRQMQRTTLTACPPSLYKALRNRATYEALLQLAERERCTETVLFLEELRLLECLIMASIGPDAHKKTAARRSASAGALTEPRPGELSVMARQYLAHTSPDIAHVVEREISVSAFSQAELDAVAESVESEGDGAPSEAPPDDATPPRNAPSSPRMPPRPSMPTRPSTPTRPTTPHGMGARGAATAAAARMMTTRHERHNSGTAAIPTASSSRAMPRCHSVASVPGDHANTAPPAAATPPMPPPTALTREAWAPGAAASTSRIAPLSPLVPESWSLEHPPSPRVGVAASLNGLNTPHHPHAERLGMPAPTAATCCSGPHTAGAPVLPTPPAAATSGGKTQTSVASIRSFALDRRPLGWAGGSHAAHAAPPHAGHAAAAAAAVAATMPHARTHSLSRTLASVSGSSGIAYLGHGGASVSTIADSRNTLVGVPMPMSMPMSMPMPAPAPTPMPMSMPTPMPTPGTAADRAQESARAPVSTATPTASLPRPTTAPAASRAKGSARGMHGGLRHGAASRGSVAGSLGRTGTVGTLWRGGSLICVADASPMPLPLPCKARDATQAAADGAAWVPEALVSLCHALYHHFLRPGAAQEVNISAAQRARIERQLEANRVRADCFTEVRREVETMVLSGIFLKLLAERKAKQTASATSSHLDRSMENAALRLPVSLPI